MKQKAKRVLFLTSVMSIFSIQVMASELPSVFDWRNINGNSYVAIAGDQGKCGSCVAFAMMTTLESQLNIKRNTPYAPWEFSRQFVFSCGGGDCRKGWRLSEAVEYLVNEGAPDGACMPYISGVDGQDAPCQLGCGDASDRAFRIAGYETPTMGFGDVETIKQALLKGPLLSSLILFDDFERYKGGVYQTSRFARNRGSHAVVLVGWDDSKEAWIGRNSMGEQWGESGDFHIAWNDRSLPGRYTYQFSIEENESPFVAFENLRNDGVLAGDVTFKVHGGAGKLDRLEVFVVQDSTDLFSLDPNYRFVQVAPSDMVSEDVRTTKRDWRVQGVLPASRLDNGTYFLYGVAYHDGGRTTTQPLRVKIANDRVVAQQ
jgi:hypothetical protein